MGEYNKEEWKENQSVLVEADVEDLLSEQIIMKAVKHIKKRKGVPGFDTMRTQELPQFWNEHGERIKDEIRAGKYQPLPVEKRLVNKQGKKEKRGLEIPCVIDRMILFAIYMIVSPYYEAVFSDNSFGFRKGRGCSNALMTCLNYMNEGYDYIVDLDIKNFFDTIQHNLIFQKLEEDVRDSCIVSLIESYIKVKVVYGRHIYRKYIGIIQGGAISPLLANIFLDSFDKYMEQEEIKYIRYADDVLLFCKSMENAENLLCKVRGYLQQVLYLCLNEEKTKIVRPEQLKYLGYYFKKISKGKYCFGISKDIENRMLEGMRKNIERKADSMEKCWDRIGGFNRAWINYYKYVNQEEMLIFLKQAEQKEMQYVHDRLISYGSDTYLKSLCNSKNFISLVDWYQYCMERDRYEI